MINRNKPSCPHAHQAIVFDAKVCAPKHASRKPPGNMIVAAIATRFDGCTPRLDGGERGYVSSSASRYAVCAGIERLLRSTT